MTANQIPEAAVDALYDELFRVGKYLHAPVPIDPKGIIRRHLTAAQQQAHPAPPSAPVGVELAALRVQEWLHREHDILCPVQEIEQAMRTPCSCSFTERALAQQPAAVDEAKETDLWRCTVCGRVGAVGRCCGEETREPFRPNTQVQPCREAAALAQPGGSDNDR